MEKQKDFIELRDLWGQHTLQCIVREQKAFLNKVTFNIGLAKKMLEKVTKKNVTRVICVVNMCIPMTFFIITNPIIIKISNKIDKDVIGRKINCIKMRFM